MASQTHKKDSVSASSVTKGEITKILFHFIVGFVFAAKSVHSSEYDTKKKTQTNKQVQQICIRKLLPKKKPQTFSQMQKWT